MAVEKIERVLGSLSARELLALERYLDSAYFQIPKAIRDFGKSYLHARRAPQWPALAAHEKWTQVFPDAPFQDGKWRKRKTQLLEWVLKFLTAEQHGKEVTDLSAVNALLRAYYARGLGQEFEALLGEAEKCFAPATISNEQDVFEQVKLWEIAYNYAIGQEDLLRASDWETSLLQRRIEAFDRFVMFDYLRTTNGLENRRQMRKTVAHLTLPDGFVAFLNSHRQGEIPLIKSHVRLFDLLVEGKDAPIGTFITHFEEDLAVLDPSESQWLFDYAINLLIRRYLKLPTLEMANEVFDLYRVALASPLWRQSLEPFPLQHFKNICTVGCRVGEIAFVTDFIGAKAPLLHQDEELQNVLAYCEALVLFENGSYEECLAKLHTLEMAGNMKLEVRMLTIRSWCARDEWDVVETHLQSFERFLQRSEISNSRQKAMLSRVRMIRKIIALNEIDPKSYARLQTQIQTEHLLDSEWLQALLTRKKNIAP
jgi:hypothetical protein